MALTARESFLANLEYLRQAVDSPSVLNPTTTDELLLNAARFTRNGLAVLGFVVLEDFLRARGDELAALLSNGVAHFDSMPVALRRAATVRTVLNLAWRVGHVDEDEVARDSLIRQTGSALGTLGASGFAVSPLALSWAGSNLGRGDVETLLEALHVEKPWPSLTHTVNRLGFSEIKDARAAFDSVQGQRHRAAHQAGADIDLVALAAMPRTVLALGMAFDILATNAVAKLRSGETGFLQSAGLRASALKYRILADRGQQLAELAGEQAKKASYLHADLPSALVAALPRARQREETVVIVDNKAVVVDWRIP